MNTEVSKVDEGTVPLVDRVRSFAALGDPIRLQIVDSLAESDLSPDQVAAALGIAGNLLAHHLRVLEDAGLISRTHSQSDRRRIYVRLESAALLNLLPTPAAIKASRVVFVCTHNSARSILAEAVWRQMSEVPSASAGTQPAMVINPRALSAAKRAGLDIAKKTPESIDTILRDDDVVVSVCDAVNEHLPSLDQPHFHWSIPDPSRIDTDAAFASALEEIAIRVGELAPRISFRPPNRRAS